MRKRFMLALVVALGVVNTLQAAVITLVNTIPAGNLFQQPPLLTGAAPVFGTGGGVVAADAFTSPVSADLDQVSVVIQYEDFLQFGVTGRSPMLLTLLTDNRNSPGAPIESWTVALNPADTSLTVVTVNSVTNAPLLAGQQYWLSEVPADPVHTGIGWGLAAPGTQLPFAEAETGMNSGWGPATLNLANEFSVTGTTGTTTVPEPAISGINAIILFCLVTQLRRRKR